MVDEERGEIARELHDDIGSALTALRLDMNWIEQHGDAASADRARQPCKPGPTCWSPRCGCSSGFGRRYSTRA
ncbi:MAG: histidine kinase dimerization/phosphoacceptor domain-containing protein [Lautropia sp.]|nr:histidine kinase dimerization/phosphoacceptor domain-containing protein [Lautropia sp.]